MDKILVALLLMSFGSLCAEEPTLPEQFQQLSQLEPAEAEAGYLKLAGTKELSVKCAAEQLQKYIGMMSCPMLDIVSAPTGKYPVRVFVGQSETTEKLGFDLKGVKYDGYRILAKANDAIVAGVDIDH